MKKTLLLVSILFLLALGYCSNAQIISTIAGNGTVGYGGDGGMATAAEFHYPVGIGVDAANTLYIGDYTNDRIRKITPTGIITTVAGNGTHGYSGDGGSATAAQLAWPSHVAVDAGGNLYIADNANNRVRKVDPAGIITTIAGNSGIHGYSGDGGPASAAMLYIPDDVVYDHFTGNLYITEAGNHCIRKMTPGGIITTVAGNGTFGFSGDGGAATSAQLNTPYGIAIDAAGNIFIADFNNYRIRKVDTEGKITTVAGTGVNAYSGDGGPATAAEISEVQCVIVDGEGNVYFADTDNERIRKINTAGTISTIAGTGTAGHTGDGGFATAAELYDPTGLVIDGHGNMDVVELADCYIRKISSVVTGVGPVAKTQAAFMNVYPNPNAGIFRVSLSSPVQEEVSVSLANAFGEKVKEWNMATNQEMEVQLNIPSGTYLISAVSGGQKVSAKVFVGQ